MNRKYGINYGPVQQKIFVGRLNKANTMMLDDKEDATMHAMVVVARYIQDKFDGNVEIEGDGVPTLSISVKEFVEDE